MSAAVVAWIWNNKQMIAECIGCLVVAMLIWWFGIHNPAKIKAQQAQIAALRTEVSNAHAAINLMTTIEARHDSITKISYRNISSIRYTPKPGRNGVFVPGGVLRSLY